MIAGNQTWLITEMLNLTGVIKPELAERYIATIGYQDYYAVTDPAFLEGLYSYNGMFNYYLSIFHSQDGSVHYSLVDCIDLFDVRATKCLDLGARAPSDYHNKYELVIDIGSIEHIHNATQCLENYLLMAKVNGHIIINTPVSGWYRHGYHTFSPEFFLDVFQHNQCQVRYLKYTDLDGHQLDPDAPDFKRQDGLMWVVAQKTMPLAKMVIPQQPWDRFNGGDRTAIH